LELIYETIRLTALIYSSSILSLGPLSKSSSPGQIATLHRQMWKTTFRDGKRSQVSSSGSFSP
jgi:hypothetical protein